MVERLIRDSIQEVGVSLDTLRSYLNLSLQAIIGRQKSWSTSMMTTTIVRIA